MQDGSDHRFTFVLGDLPRSEFVELSDALDLAFYGGVLSVQYEGPLSLSAVEDGAPSISQGEWVVHTDFGPVRGPRCVEVARPGAILFAIDDRSEPDPLQLAEHETKYLERLERHQNSLAERAAGLSQLEDGQANLAQVPVPRRYGSDAVAPFWKAEIARRQAAFYKKLNIAARSADVRFMGIPDKGPWTLEPSTYGSMPLEIPTAYFIADRDFDENGIHAIGARAAEPEYDQASADSRYVSYRDVVVLRVSFLRFLKINYPSVLSSQRAQEQLKTKEAILRLAQGLVANQDMTKAAAAELVGWSVRSRRFENEIWPEALKVAGLDPQGRPGRKRKPPRI